MRTLLMALLIFMVGFVGTIQAEESSERKLDKLEKLEKPQKAAMSLEAEFLANNWEIDFPVLTNDFSPNVKVIFIVDAKNKTVKIRIQNTFRRLQTPLLKMTVQDNILHFVTEEGQGMMEIKRNDKGKLVCLPMKNDVKTGDIWDLKIFEGSVK